MTADVWELMEDGVLVMMGVAIVVGPSLLLGEWLAFYGYAPGVQADIGATLATTAIGLVAAVVVIVVSIVSFVAAGYGARRVNAWVVYLRGDEE